MKDAPIGSKDNVAKLKKGNCDEEQCLSNLLPLLYLGFTYL